MDPSREPNQTLASFPGSPRARFLQNYVLGKITQSRLGEVVTTMGYRGLAIGQSKPLNEEQLEGKSNASSRGNSSSYSVY